MTGIISLLSGEAYLQVRNAKRDLEAKHKLSTPEFFHPHLTFVIGEKAGDRVALIQRMETLAAETDPLPITTEGLGLFPGEKLVLYLPAPRSLQLAAVHQALYQIYCKVGESVQPYYRPEVWLPHVTLVSRNLTHELVPAVIGDLAECCNLRSQLLGFCLVEEVEPERWEITREFPFRGLDDLGPNPFGLSSRPCQPSDRRFVYQLVEQTLKPLVSVYVEWDENRFEQNFARTWRQRKIILAEGRPVGCIQYDKSHQDHLHIGNLFLIPAMHGRGWGGWLLDFMEGQAAGKPIRLHVWQNNPAVEFYRHRNYRVVAQEGAKYLMQKGQ